jgi:hypothetical protein
VSFTVGLGNQSGVDAIANEGAALEVLLRKSFVGRNIFLHLSPLQAWDGPVGDVGIRRGFSFSSCACAGAAKTAIANVVNPQKSFPDLFVHGFSILKSEIVAGARRCRSHLQNGNRNGTALLKAGMSGKNVMGTKKPKGSPVGFRAGLCKHLLYFTANLQFHRVG